VVVDYLDVQRIAIFPAKADAPLIVDPDAVLSFSAASQGFQSIARRDPKIL
jgi:hypothetical protein